MLDDPSGVPSNLEYSDSVILNHAIDPGTFQKWCSPSWGRQSCHLEISKQAEGVGQQGSYKIQHTKMIRKRDIRCTSWNWFIQPGGLFSLEVSVSIKLLSSAT